MHIRGTRILVTGASRGIGASLARHLAAKGAEVALVARTVEPLDALAAELGGRAYPADLTDVSALGGLWSRITEDGQIDVLVNNAGTEYAGPFVDMTSDEIDRLYRLNLTTPTELCRLAMRDWLDRGSGHIVNVSSVAASITGAGLAVYGGSKAGLSHFTHGLNRELKGSGIGTTTVEIGPTRTDMIQSLYDYPATNQAVARLTKLGLLVELDPEVVSAAIVTAIENDIRVVRLPRRTALTGMLVSTPRRVIDLIGTGIDPRPKV